MIVSGDEPQQGGIGSFCPILCKRARELRLQSVSQRAPQEEQRIAFERPIVQPYLPLTQRLGDVDLLNLRRSAIDRLDARIRIDAGNRTFGHVTIAAVEL